MELNTEFLFKYEELMNKDVEEALNYSIKMLKKSKNPDIYAYIADCLMVLDNFEDAVYEINKGLSLGCSNKNFALSLKGEALFYLEKYEESKEIFIEILKENSNSFFAVAYLTDIDIKLGNYLEGIKRAEDIILNENFANGDLAYINTNIGWIYLRYLNDLDKSYKCFNKALELSSDTSITYVGFGEYYFKIGQYLKAITNFEKAIELGESTLDVYYSIALSYKGLKRYEDSLNYFKMINQVDENFNDVSIKISEIEELII